MEAKKSQRSYTGHGETYEVLLSRDRRIQVGRDLDTDVLKRLIAVVES
jgi:hypothetical protein